MWCLLLVGVALANVPVPANWQPLPYGTCTKLRPDKWWSATEFPTTPKSWELDPEIPEVSTGMAGDTCGYSTKFGAPLPEMPKLYKDLYRVAVTQDMYNGRFTPVCDSCNNVNRDWERTCNLGSLTEQNAADGAMCASMCGECVLVNGGDGAAVFMVTEMADANRAGTYGVGVGLHIANGHFSTVRRSTSVGRDITFKRVTCPVDGSVHIHYQNTYHAEQSLRFVIYNHRVGIKSVHVQGGAGAADDKWVPLARDWRNTWHWSSYPSAESPSWQEGPIHRGATAGDFNLKITGHTGVELICSGLKGRVTGTTVECMDASAVAQQFPAPADYAAEISSCNAKKAVSNLEYYPYFGQMCQGKAEGDACEDHNDDTVNDKCTSGVCAGTSALPPDGWQREIFDVVRELRRGVNPPAFDMDQLQWDATLAQGAQEQATTKCTGRNIASRNNLHGFSYVGQLARAFEGDQYDPSKKGSGTKVASEWSAVKALYDTVLSCADGGNTCGPYRQMVWHNSGHIGCGTQLCDKGGIMKHVYICWFGEGGLGSNEFPYKSATSLLAEDGRSQKGVLKRRAMAAVPAVLIGGLVAAVTFGLVAAAAMWRKRQSQEASIEDYSELAEIQV